MLGVIRAGAPISRAEISRRARISKPTVSLALQALLDDVQPALLFGKTVNSAFLGEVDLDRWLRERGITRLVVCGIQTNMCV